ncbi:MAG TPA: aspartate aminotransferase family protein [Hyphomicrobiaceae bacterium]|jgi:acetylornithine/N-succinyldiaminopimelate aminotransferase|nr:aspartate aminotransferase family protein [Hyphomicrobiaceae bacterium]
MPTYARQNVVFERGEGAWLISTSGERYLDFASGVAVNALGHTHPKLIAALTEQAHKLWHSSNLYRIAGQERLAERLCAATFADKVFFCNSGAEACEGAIKLARRYHFANGAPERWRIITFKGAFHGRTLATIAAAGNEKHLEGFGQPADGFDLIALADLEAVEKAIGPHTAGIMIEPVQGEGGARVVDRKFLQALRQLADQHGLLLILDEVQSGIGRTGKLFAHEWAGVTPDVMAIAKGIGGGFPVGAFLASNEAAKGMVPGTHGSTFGGNPLAMAVGNAVLDAVLEPGFLEHVQTVALRFKQELARIKDEFPNLVEEVRGSGLLMGIKVKPPYGDVVNACTAEKLLTVGAGDNVVRLLPPLNVTEAEIMESTRRLAAALHRLAKPAT